eukprot:TRINITY_DN12133_c0_g1_i1.p1 TRINITY_DN12133_c0_g1~~TRINITY_DN12133_c0_g1_i1.p1  ORF type:complete len:321 (+),score=93.99 TRINITY_DN12133_c0_g1_i1:218-1180(+)
MWTPLRSWSKCRGKRLLWTTPCRCTRSWTTAARSTSYAKSISMKTCGTARAAHSSEVIAEEETLKDILTKELEGLKKQEALFRAKDSKNKETSKSLTASLQAIHSSKQDLSDGIKSINKEVEDIMGSLSKVVSEIVELIEKENSSEEGLGKIRFCAPAKVVMGIIDNYKVFVTTLQEHLDSIAKLVEKDKDSPTSNELTETLDEAKKLAADILSVKEADLNMKLYEKRLIATEEFLASEVEEDKLEDVSNLLKEEEAKIKQLHSEIKEVLQMEVQSELDSKFKNHIKQLAGNNLLALAPSILIKIEEIISKHMVHNSLIL